MITTSEATTFEGLQPMTDRAIDHDPHLGPVNRVVPLLKTAALVVTIVGAIPTAITAYHAWQYKVPFSQVSHRLAQYEIWERNIDCPIEYKALSTAEGTKIDAGACDETGDISLKVSTGDGKATYEWIAYNQLQKPGEAPPPNGILDLLIGAARADAAQTKGVHLAQSGMEVMCQALVSKQQLVRVVKENGKCYREVMSPVRGTVDKRDEVPCETTCKAG
ncbi:MAG: hypothetical protein J0H65_08600 [Rhizobiales bacterium]|nr:hypothetical protein [Hyphomicrobiales bacterium]